NDNMGREIVNQVDERNTTRINIRTSPETFPSPCCGGGNADNISSESFSLSFEESNSNSGMPNDGSNHGLETKIRRTNKLTTKDFFTYLGNFIGAAIFHGHTVAPVFSLVFLENLLNRDFKIRHIQDVVTQKNMIKYEISSAELKEMVFTPKEKAYNLIRNGFYKFQTSSIRKFSAEELCYLLNGRNMDNIENINMLLGFESSSPENNYLVNILQEKSIFKKFVQFATGTATLPISAFKQGGFKIKIEQVNQRNALFRANCCIRTVTMGVYDNETKMREILYFSLENTEGFHKV
ncbi:E3 ubiquitin-protein ligase pub2, partial [Dictyocoela roeselum]